MFHVYHSNQLNCLKDLLVALIQTNPQADPFKNETVLVQSPGMAQWLNIEIAQATGIATNIDYPLPASFIWQQFKHVLKDIPDQSPFNKMSLTWQIMKTLPEYLDDPDFTELNQYLENDTLVRKRYQLSQKIAYIFDQYLVYRPEWIDAWELASDQEISTWENKNSQSTPRWLGDQRWQVKLWKILSAKIESCYSSNGKVYHGAGLYKEFLAKLAIQKTLKHLPERIFIFGVSALPEAYLQALLGLAKHCDVHFLLSNPCQFYWGDIVDPKLLAKRFAQLRPKLSVQQGQIENLADTSWQKDEDHKSWALSEDIEAEIGNPLLASMGKMGRDFLYQLYTLEQNEIDAFVDIDRDSLLHHLQADILALQDSSLPLDLDASSRIVIKDNDDSFCIHLAHSVMREVEILHDNLLSLFEKDRNLTPKDIIVMMPNIDLYAPYVQAVFSGLGSQGDHQNWKQKIPFTISDVSAQQESPILMSFLHLLNLNQTRYTREDVLGLLEVPAILNRFKINQSDFVLLKKWIDESGIRWGLHNKSALQWDLPELTQNSWLFGLKRMLLGFAMGDSMFEGISAYDEVQGLQGDLLGRFIDFIDELISLESTLTKDHTAIQWQLFIYQLVENFYFEDEDNSALLSSIRKQIDSLVTHTQAAQYTQTLSLFVLIEHFEKHLLTALDSQRFLAGKVNFCALMPMHSIPFKVVCLLGMNDGQYPRNIVPLGFDLMAGHRKRGDRSRREEDRYLFLEAIVSAQDKLYISYVGRNINDNSEKMASVLVRELLNYCLQSFTLKAFQKDASDRAEKALSNFIHQQYPMQSFSGFYYTGQFKTYNNQWWPAIRDNEIKGDPIDEKIKIVLAHEQIKEVQIKQLINFLKHSCKFFFTQRLGVYFELEEGTLDDNEPFLLNGLEKYKLKEQQFEHALYGKSQIALFAELKAKGELPLGEFAPLIFNQNLQNMQDLACIVKDYFVDELEAIHVEICFDKDTEQEKQLLGELTEHCVNGLIRRKTGKIKSKDILTLWVEHLCYSIAHIQDLNSTLFGEENVIFFEAMPVDFAHQRLGELLHFYDEGLQSPAPFFVESCFAWAELVHSVEPDCFVYDDLQCESRTEGKNAALIIFNNERGFPESNDPYIQRAFNNLEDNWPEFEKIAFTIFKPILANINSVEYEEWEGAK
ncbi:MAG: exodeoxyribonuclease V subunit gamma [Psychromonas sp.]|nr:exodeoxyribonuclease V subunit gamma [Psychromonas sp.]